MKRSLLLFCLCLSGCGLTPEETVKAAKVCKDGGMDYWVSYAPTYVECSRPK